MTGRTHSLAVRSALAGAVILAGSLMPEAVTGAAAAQPRLSHPTALTNDGIASTQGKVKRLIARVHAVSRRVSAAEQAYSRALNAVASGVTSAISADRNDAAVKQLEETSQTRLDARVLDLYASGGSISSVGSLLVPGGLSEYTQTTHIESDEVAVAVKLAKARRSVEAAAAAHQAATNKTAYNSIETQSRVNKIAAQVTNLLDVEQRLLSQAKRQLASQQAAAAARAALTTATSTFSSDTSEGVNAVGILPPPADYLAWYRSAAATCPGLSWTVLAAIGQVESGHGRNDEPSSAGALGPMQFEPGTFAAYAVDGDGDGKAEIDDPADSIFTAAHYLCANGAGRGGNALSNAILDYNHAEWYVQLVLGLAQKYAASYGS